MVKSIKETDIISASEIGKFHYCSVAWYLQKNGYQPESLKLDTGIKKHVELGRIIDNAEYNIKKSKVLTILGYLILTAGILFLLFGVIL